MSGFDNVLVVNIRDKAFGHNNVWFQTKSLDWDGNDYIIFNGQLWQQGEKEDEELASALDYSGTLNIYTNHTRFEKSYWIEYDITLENGKVISVELVSERILKDMSDKSSLRPAPKSKSSCIHVDFRGVDNEVYENFQADIDSSLKNLRDAIGDNKAEIVYQVKRYQKGLLGMGGPETRWIHSVVQDISDFEQISTEQYRQTDSDGNTLTLFVDEFSEIASIQDSCDD